MHIISNHNKDVLTPDKPSGGYEWWYFDAYDSKADLGFVIIFYHGNPFSINYIESQSNLNSNPGNYPAISISVYKGGKTIYYSFTEMGNSDMEYSDDPMSFTLNDHLFKQMIEGEKLVYTLKLDEELPSGDEIEAELNFESNIPTNNEFGEETNEKHYWNLVQPMAQVSGSIEINDNNYDFEGLGYHDHNVGLERMDQTFDDWYWGRFHFDDFTLIYYVMNTQDGEDYKAWLIGEDGKVLQSFDEINLDYYGSNLFGLKSARKISLKAEHAKAEIQTHKILDNGPFYQRFKSQVVLQFEGDVKSVEGISEYIRPRSILKKAFWPLVRMRIYNSTQKPHWVQKSKTLYRWTW